MKRFKRLPAIIVGLVFFFAGLFKLNDPVGTGLHVEEYYNFFHLYFLRPTAGVVAVTCSLFETVLGAALMTGVWKKLVALASAVVLGFFTLLTLILLIANPAMDCGCFGDAIPLTHLQSFLKNIVLDLLWMLAFLPLNEIEPARKVKIVSFWITTISVAIFTLYSIFTIPAIDFTPFSPGNVVSEEVDVPGSAVLSFYDATGEYRDSLAMKGRVMVASVYNPEDLGAGAWKEIGDALGEASRNGFTPLLLVASSPDAIAASQQDNQSLLPMIYFADRRTLMTLNRSNGGMTYISNGLIICKWARRTLPDSERLSALAAKEPMGCVITENAPQRMKLQGFLLYVFAVMLLL